MLAERLSSPEEILEKLNGKCIAEYKYDGERIQIHKKNEKIILYSRRLENISKQYPDLIKLIKRHVIPKEAILEAECVAIDIDTEEMKPFQELMHRRRKYGIEKAVKNYPVSLFIFEMLYINGKDLTLKTYMYRRQILEENIKTGRRVKIAKNIITNKTDELEKFFFEAIENGCEGIICKAIGKKSVYQAGSRGWLWIKYKRDYKSHMSDTVDLVIVGAYHGRGKRAGKYGTLLLAAYNLEKNVFETITKIGTGFTDEDLVKIPKILEKHRITKKDQRVKSLIEADLWFKPVVVIEVLGAEITLSPIHVCAQDVIRKGSGVAIRFPRFTGKYRFDKAAEDATSTKEVVKMYQKQLKTKRGES
jgi:DNA ligase-1